MVRELRRGGGSPRQGLILANGGVLSYQHVVCLSNQPRRDQTPYPTKNPLPELLTEPPAPAIEEQVEGEAVIEVRCRISALVGLIAYSLKMHLANT
jgi:hypothetical protein